MRGVSGRDQTLLALGMGLGRHIRRRRHAGRGGASNSWGAARKFMTSFYTELAPYAARASTGPNTWPFGAQPSPRHGSTRVGSVHGPSPIRALSGNREGAACAARLLHQASFTASSIHNQIFAKEGADWLVRAVRARFHGRGGGQGPRARAARWRGQSRLRPHVGGDRRVRVLGVRGPGRHGYRPTSTRPGAPGKDGSTSGPRAYRRRRGHLLKGRSPLPCVALAAGRRQHG